MRRAVEEPGLISEAYTRFHGYSLGNRFAALIQCLKALEKQFDCLNDRKPKGPAAIFVKSCREMWALPEPYISRLEAHERVQKAREVRRTNKSRKLVRRL